MSRRTASSHARSRSFWRRRGSQLLRSSLIVAVFAYAGAALLYNTRAATYAATAQAESATLSGNATTVSNTGASGSSAVQFGGTNSAPANDLADPVKKEIAMELVSSAENSSLNWKANYGYIEWNVEQVASENRGYTGGIIGFCSGCGDMTQLVQYYTQIQPSNVLSKYIPYLQREEQAGMGHVSQNNLGTAFINDWKSAASGTGFQKAQNDERDRSYFNPAVTQGRTDGLGALGQFIYYDALVVHGPGNDNMSFGGIRSAALATAKPPSQGGNETTYLNAFLNARVKVMQAEEAHADVTRIENAQRVFLKAGNLTLSPPLNWSVYGDPYSIKTNPTP